MANRMGPNDWRSATEVDDDGHAAFVQNVNIMGGDGQVVPQGGFTPADVAASQTDEAVGGEDSYVSHVIIYPANTSPGVVTIVDGATVLVAFAGGASSVAGTAPITLTLGVRAATSIVVTTGADVAVTLFGVWTAPPGP